MADGLVEGPAPEVHPSSVVSPDAQLGPGVSIGPFCLVGPDVVLGAGVRLVSHAVVTGRTRVGARTTIYPFASLGHPPQDLKYRGEPTDLVVGEGCLVREGVTMNPGTAGGGGVTRVGDRCVLLAQSHVAHDCQVGQDVILSNNVMLAGHCTIGDHAILGGGCGVHQFSRIGTHAFVGGLAALSTDLIPYGMAFGNHAHLAGLNVVGLRRRGFDRDQVQALRRAYRLLFANEGTLKERIEDVAAEFAEVAPVQEIVTFIREGGDRGLCMPRQAAAEP